jgi:hypothetical protein
MEWIDDNSPFRARMIYRERSGEYFRKSHDDKSWYKTKQLVKGHENRPFKVCFRKVKPFLRHWSQPMHYVLSRWFDEESAYKIENGIIKIRNYKKLDRNPLPRNVIFENETFFLITEESKVGKQLFLIKHKGEEYINYFHYYGYSYKHILYADFIAYHVKGHKDRDKYNLNISKKDADYFLYPERFMYRNYRYYDNNIIDITKCVRFKDKKTLRKHITKAFFESRNKRNKKNRRIEKDKKQISDSLLGKAMVDFNLRKEKEKQLRQDKDKMDAIASAYTRDRFGFDETSFTTFQPRMKKSKK